MTNKMYINWQDFEMGFLREMTHQKGVTMSHMEPICDGKLALRTDFIFVGIFVVFMFITAMLNNQVIREIVRKGMQMNSVTIKVEKVALMGVLTAVSLGITLSILFYLGCFAFC